MQVEGEVRRRKNQLHNPPLFSGLGTGTANCLSAEAELFFFVFFLIFSKEADN